MLHCVPTYNLNENSWVIARDHHVVFETLLQIQIINLLLNNPNTLLLHCAVHKEIDVPITAGT